MRRKEQIARELFYEDWDREHIIGLVDSGVWEDCPKHIKSTYYKEADSILSLTTQHQEELAKECFYCGKKPDGAMLKMGTNIAHADCVIRKLNELLDPDWEIGDTREPDKIIGSLAGYVKVPESPKDISPQRARQARSQERQRGCL